MAKGKYHKWLGDDGREQLINWAAHGCTDTEIAQNIGISRNTYYKWIAAYSDIDDAIKKGREMCAKNIENMFFRKAMGMCQEQTTTKEVEQRMVDGELVTVHKVVKETTKNLAPDTGALIFYLKNKLGYRDNPPDDSDAALLSKVSEILVAIEGATDAA